LLSQAATFSLLGLPFLKQPKYPGRVGTLSFVVALNAVLLVEAWILPDMLYINRYSWGYGGSWNLSLKTR
jgi:hypothetical protein